MTDTSQNSIGGTVRAAGLAFALVLSMIAAPVLFSAPAAATSHQDDTIQDGGLYWQGQMLQFSDTNISSGDSVILRDGDGNFVREYTADSNGNIYVDTSERSGFYTLHDSAGNQLAKFEVTEQSFDVTTESSTVDNSTTSGSEATVNLDSNRSGYSVYVSSQNYTASEIQTLFGGQGTVVTVTEDGESVDYLRFDVTGNGGDYPVDFEGEEAGDYNFNFEVVDSNASDSQSFTVQDAGSASASFTQNSYEGVVGDEAEFTITAENTQTVAVQFGSQDMGYTYNFDVDMGGQKEATILFDTTKAGEQTVPVRTPDDSDAQVINASADQKLSDKLDSGSYNLEASVNGEITGASVINLQQRETGSATSHVAPQNANISDIKTLSESATQDSTIALGDKFIVEVNVNGIFEYLDETATAGDLAAGSTFAQNNGIYVEVVEQNPEMNTNAEKLDVSKATLYRDAENGQVFLVFDTSDYSALEDGSEFDATFHVDERNPYIESEDAAESATTSLTFEERNVELNTNEENVIEAEKAEDEVISGTSNVAPGTELSVRVRGSNYIQTSPATVSEDGSFEASFNFTVSDVGDSFTAEVRNETSEYDGIVVEPGYNVNFNVVDADGNALSDVTVEFGDSVYVTDDNGAATVTVKEGSYEATFTKDGYQNQTKTVEVTGETSVDVTLEEEVQPGELTLNVADADDNSVDATVMIDGEEYAADGGSVTAELAPGTYTVNVSADGYQDSSTEVTINDGEATEASVTLEEEATETEPTPTETQTEEEPETTSESETPGFGAIVALIALLAAAAFAMRRS